MSFSVFLRNKRGISYGFELRRKVTVIRGDSGTGKTALYTMVHSIEQGSAEYQCKYRLISYTHAMTKGLENLSNCVIFVDEDNLNNIEPKALARTINNSNCFWVLLSRYAFKEIPYSMDEIYEFVSNGTKVTTRRLYSPVSLSAPLLPDYVYCEDAGSGCDFYRLVFPKSNVESVGGNGNIMNHMPNLSKSKSVVFAVDAAAFGGYIADFCRVLKKYKLSSCFLFAPESVEYLILRSHMFLPWHKLISADLSAFKTNIEYVSWERYFSNKLTKLTNDTPASYNKSRLKECYMKTCCCKKMPCKLFCREERIKSYGILEMLGGKNVTRLFH